MQGGNEAVSLADLPVISLEFIIHPNQTSKWFYHPGRAKRKEISSYP